MKFIRVKLRKYLESLKLKHFNYNLVLQSLKEIHMNEYIKDMEKILCL